MPGLVLLVIVVIVIIVFATMQDQQRRKAWVAAAKQIGFHVTQGGAFANPEMHGTMDRCKVSVIIETRRRGKHSTRYTVFRVHYPRAPGVAFHISEAGLLSGIGKFFGAQDIDTGDGEFDEAFTIKGESPEEVVRFLTPERRTRIADFLRRYRNAVVGGDQVQWEQHGAISDAQIIKAKARDLVRFAVGLVGVPTEEEPEEPGARPETRAAPAPWEAVAEDAEEAAPQELDEAPPEKAAPEFAAEPGEPEPSLSEPEPSLGQPEPPPGEPEPGLSESEPPPGVGPGLEEVCQALFGPKRSIFETRRTFEERYQGRDVAWEGRLRSVDRYSYDFALGSEPGVKGTFEVFDAPSALSGDTKVLAAVSFSPEEYERLEGRIGSTVRFEGRLREVDGFMRTIYVAGGTVCD